MFISDESKLDRALGIILAGLSIVLFAVGASIIFPQTKANNNGVIQDVSFDMNPLAQEFVEVSTDYSLKNYQEFIGALSEKLEDKQYAITLHHFSDPSRDFSINGDKIMGAASTYKLFTAYSMYKSGYAPACLDTMIIHSDNICPEDWGRWDLITSDARAIGAESTNLDAVPTLTTSNDLALFLTKLYDGSLLPSPESEHLISIMKTQIFREGIPTGIPEAEIANKVGFLDEALNDAGIVYSEKGDFVLVILTSGYSRQSIADMASEIYAMM